MGNDSVASAAGSHPRHRLFGQATPGPSSTLRPAAAAQGKKTTSTHRGKCYEPLDAKRHRYARQSCVGRAEAPWAPNCGSVASTYPSAERGRSTMICMHVERPTVRRWPLAALVQAGPSQIPEIARGTHRLAQQFLGFTGPACVPCVNGLVSHGPGWLLE
jgi:hypothetical protein